MSANRPRRFTTRNRRTSASMPLVDDLDPVEDGSRPVRPEASEAFFFFCLNNHASFSFALRSRSRRSSRCLAVSIGAGGILSALETTRNMTLIIYLKHWGAVITYSQSVAIGIRVGSRRNKQKIVALKDIVPLGKRLDNCGQPSSDPNPTVP